MSPIKNNSDSDIKTSLADFHTHAMPGIDDGAPTLEESRKMLLQMKQTGIGYTVLTPHFYPEMTSLEDFLGRRASAYSFLSQIDPEERPLLFLGAEVAYFPSIGKARSISEVCIQGTNVLLLEMPFYKWDRTVIDDIAELIYTQKLQVVLAHIERYFEFGAKKYLQNLLDVGVFLQINAEALLEPKTRKKVLPLIKSGKIHLMGSDAHRAEGTRTPNLAEGILRLRSLAPECEERMGEIGKRLLGIS